MKQLDHVGIHCELLGWMRVMLGVNESAFMSVNVRTCYIEPPVAYLKYKSLKSGQ